MQVVSLSLLTTFSSSKLNELRFGYSRYRTSFTAADGNVDPASLGLNMGTGQNGLPEIDFNGNLENLGASAYSIPRGRVSQTYQLLDHFTINGVKHIVKFGGEFRHISVSSYNDNLERGLLDVQGNTYTGDPVVDAIYSFFIGDFYASAYTGNTQRTTFNNGASLFVQDDYKVARHLTANIGLRWEYFGPLSRRTTCSATLGQMECCTWWAPAASARRGHASSTTSRRAWASAGRCVPSWWCAPPTACTTTTFRRT